MKILLSFFCFISFAAFAQDQTELNDDVQSLYPIAVDKQIKTNKKIYTDSELMVLQNLESRRIELERKAQVLVIREKLIDLSEIRLLDKIKQLEALQSNIKDLLIKVSKKEEQRLNDLAIVYSEMKPALAAERLNILEDYTVYEVLRRMNFKKSAKILEKMNVKKVTVVSKMLAEKTLLPAINK
jgi:flagellar motility protein MotE (MotC chaperone)